MNRTNLKRRHLKVRRSVAGTKEKLRLSVFRSGQHIYGQIINDQEGKTIVSESDIKMERKGKTKSELSFEVGRQLAQKALKLKITNVVFDRGGFLYHGRVAKLAEGARKGGLKF